MSATNRGSKRSPGDFYVTPAYCVHYLLDNVPLQAGRWLEPGAGTGAIISASRGDPKTADVHWTAVEKYVSRIGRLCNICSDRDMVIDADFLKFDFGARRYHLAVGNPPFSLATQFIDRSLHLAPRAVFLLRLNFLGSKKRREFFERVGIPDVYVIVPRPSFRHSGSDATEYAWMDFRREWAGRREGRTQILYPPLPDVPEE